MEETIIIISLIVLDSVREGSSFINGGPDINLFSKKNIAKHKKYHILFRVREPISTPESEIRGIFLPPPIFSIFHFYARGDGDFEPWTVQYLGP